jgi:hypothetical protein
VSDRNELIRSVGVLGIARIFSRFHFSDYAPITLLSYAFDYSLWGLNPLGYHLTNILLHALNSVLLFRLFAGIARSAWIGLVTAALFASHPVQVEAVAWMAQRKTLLAMALFLLSFIWHVRSREENCPRHCGILAPVFLLGSVLSKPVVVGAPLLFAFYDRCFCAFPWRKVARRNVSYIVIGGAGAALGFISQYVAGGVKTYPGGTPFLSFLLMLRVFWDYLRSLFLSTSLDNLYTYNANDILHDPGVLAGALLAIGFLLFAWRQPLGRPLSAFAALWYALFLLPVSNVIPMAVQRADRYLYFPSAGAFLILALASQRLIAGLSASDRARRLKPVLALTQVSILIVSGWQTVARNRVWQNSGILWEDHLKKNPRSQTGHFNLAGYYLATKEYEWAIPLYQALVQLNARYMKAYYNLAMIASDRGDLHKALGKNELAEQAYEKANALSKREAPEAHGGASDLDAR